jgi:hypothetical protein
MTEDQIEQLYEELQEHYGDSLANFEHYPKIFAMQAKMYLYYKERDKSV